MTGLIIIFFIGMSIIFTVLLFFIKTKSGLTGFGIAAGSAFTQGLVIIFYLRATPKLFSDLGIIQIDKMLDFVTDSFNNIWVILMYIIIFITFFAFSFWKNFSRVKENLL